MESGTRSQRVKVGSLIPTAWAMAQSGTPAPRAIRRIFMFSNVNAPFSPLDLSAKMDYNYDDERTSIIVHYYIKQKEEKRISTKIFFSE